MQGKSAVLRQELLLKQLAARSGQPGAMHWLNYFLSGRGALWKRPCVVFVLNRQTPIHELQVEDLDGAVLLFELTMLGLGSGAFATDDWEATRTVIASPDKRPEVTARAIDALIEHGAQIVLTSYAGQPMPVEETERIIQRKGVLWAQHSRELKKGLALATSFDELLSRFGKATRFNLGYYRRRLNTRTEVEFLENALEPITRDEILAFNERSFHRVPEAECDRRLQALHEQDSFLIGIREKSGEWLSLLGGWRQVGTTVMFFQMNATDRPRDSIGTVMRSYFLEHEVGRGTRNIFIYHGTNHSMANAFKIESVRDVIVRRKTIRSRLLHKLLQRIDPPPYDADPKLFQGSLTFLATVLINAPSKWRITPGASKK